MNLSTEQCHPVEGFTRAWTMTDTGTAVSVIVKTRGETCDIGCLYYYEKRKEAPGGARVGAGQITRLASLFRGRPLAVELHGGEPLTAGRDHIAEILTEGQDGARRRHGQQAPADRNARLRELGVPEGADPN
ncbi:hypothetical protein [Streptomyces sp. NPDC056244]|uniref:hypothetical protein n=1 Tax=Streptomyces sp. NPDC056244 TaxID=3345762 RepID=UPI0035E1D379